jgi:hypothetical protein
MPSSPFGGSVPVPNALFDELLPELSDAELRLLLVVVRATLGWREGNATGGWQYKQRDWMTNRLLVRRTGCASASVSRAVQALVAKRLIRVESATAELLDTPEKRRRNLGRLYFGLGDMWTTPPRGDIAFRRTTPTIRKHNHAASVPDRRRRSAPAGDTSLPVRVADMVADRRAALRGSDAP